MTLTEQARANVIASNGQRMHVDALIAAVRADTLSAVEQEARRRAEHAKEIWGADSLIELAEFCRQQREGS